MTGCASFPGTVPAAHAEALTYLANHCRTEQAWDVRAIAQRYHPMDLMPLEAVSARAAIAAMPPLVKGYLRIGATFGDGAVIDRQFGTTDVLVILRTADIGQRYVSHYASGIKRAA
jgi:putative hemolysin